MKKILIIDDSALMRRVLSDIINSDSEMCVTDTAENGVEATKLFEQGKLYDLILLDINMPGMDGIGFLDFMKKNRLRIPILIISSIASKNAEETIRALELGAYDFIKKPENGIHVNMADFQHQVIAKAKCAFIIRKRPSRFLSTEQKTGEDKSVRQEEIKPERKKKAHQSEKKAFNCDFAVIASSTGGPKALQSVVSKLPSKFACPIVIVQHMPAGFTASLTKRLDEMAVCPVIEAEDGMRVEPGKIYVAKGGYHIRIAEDDNGPFFTETKDALRNGLRPCADVFLESLQEVKYEKILCVVMTGMGNDATAGLKKLKERKNVYAIGQSEQTCVVYGMPCSLVKAGLNDEVADLENIAQAMLQKM